MKIKNVYNLGYRNFIIIVDKVNEERVKEIKDVFNSTTFLFIEEPE